ncbi:nuclear transport factor 2 family protein [Rhodobacterales bacterium HKCCE2091]|nr:nuclear transport factor 2 family protein [Rhodobacterales bacterium HKCCE2091]
MEALKRLVARMEIEDCMKRYARGVDRRDWASVRACFHDDAIDHHGEFHGDGDAFIEWVSTRHANVPFSMHYILNCLVEFHSETVAHVETYFWAIQRREDDDGGTDHEVFGRYIDLFEQRDGAWRVAGRRVAYDSTRTQPSTNHLRRMQGVLGRRDRQDPVFHPQQAAE